MKVLHFPTLAKEASGLLRLNVVDSLYEHMGICRGDVLIAHVGQFIEGHTHYVELDGHGMLARLTDITEATARVAPLDRETPPRTCLRARLGSVGAILDAYPAGTSGYHWAFCPNDESRPLFEAVAN